MSEQLLTVTIDGRTVQVPKGTNMIEAAKQAGIEIPVFCYHEKLDPAGVCRMCLVQVEKIPKPQAACVTPLTDGMVIHTDTEQVATLRKSALEFLLLNHPIDCPVCDKGGECDLQDLTLQYGADRSRLQQPKVHMPKSVELGNFIRLDNERCILCRRCVRFDNERATETNLVIEERASRNFVTTVGGERYDSYFSGNVIELCPVGALTSEVYRFKARPWDLSKQETICHGCSVGCNVTEEYRFGNLLRLYSRDNEEVDAGWLCDRGRFNFRFIEDDDRITTPMIKKDGKLVPATWSEAIKTIASKVQEIKAARGGFGVIGGGKLSNEEGYLLQKFARVALGTNNVDHRVNSQIITSLGAFPGRQTDLSDAGAVLVIDTDPAQTASVMDLRIRRMTDRKLGRVAVIGSVIPKYRGRHARIQVKPGQTPAVLSALAAVVAGRQPGASAADPEALNQLAKILNGVTKVAVVWGGDNAATGRALVELASSIKKVANGGDPGRSVHVLIPGAQNNSRGAEAMGVLPNMLPGFKAVSENAARDNASRVWNVRTLPTEPGLATGEMLKAAAGGEIQALFLNGANLLNTWQDRKQAEAALDGSFVVVTDLFLNETAQKADVFLPAASSIGEKGGSWTTLDGLVQSSPVSKAPEGKAQPDGDILVALANAIGVRIANSPAETSAEIAKLFTKLTDKMVLPGAPTNVLPVDAATAATPEGLVLVPVDRLYAGGSTAQFDSAFNHVLPKPAAFIHPTDAANLGLQDGEQVELTAGAGSLQLPVSVTRSVVPGTVQVIRGLSKAPAGLLTSGTDPVAVTVAKLAVEVGH